MAEILIRLPWPPAKTSPNASRQGDWRAKSNAARSYKTSCGWECKAQGVRAIGSDTVSVEVTFHPPRNGRFDLDNALARCKQGLDAVAEAIGVDDALWSDMHLRRGDKVKGGCVLVHVRPSQGVQEIPHRGTVS
jgi:crossover junction endodeoxyribonuclease RusA